MSAAHSQRSESRLKWWSQAIVRSTSRRWPGWRWAVHAVASEGGGQLSACALSKKRLSVVLGHVAEAAAGLGVDRRATPAHLAPVRLQHPEHDPHGGGLAGAVRADEPEHLPFPDGERQVVQGHDVAVAAAQPLQLEHLACPSSLPFTSPLPRTLPADRRGALGSWSDVGVVLRVESAPAGVLTPP